MFKQLLIFLLSASSVEAARFYYIDHPKYEKSGFFYVLDCTFGAIKKIERSFPGSGLEVDYGESGLYYDEKMGPNFFTYYFEPICIGDSADYRCKEKTSGEFYPYLMFNETRIKNHEFLSHHLKVRPEIQAVVDDWAATHFAGFTVVGVHYRGTDKSTELPRVSYEKFIGEIKKELRHVYGEYRLFVASDELEFIQAMEECFPGRVVYLQDIERSSEGRSIHGNTSEPYLAGYSALVDALLLSRCDRIVKTFSNLSRWSGYFNPRIPITEVRNNEILHY